jgi:hypothetical protein
VEDVEVGAIIQWIVGKNEYEWDIVFSRGASLLPQHAYLSTDLSFIPNTS